MNNITLGKWTLTNFKVHENIEIDYSINRLVTLTGENGTGKSTLIVDSICWAMYNEDSEGRTGDSVVNNRIGKNTSVIGEWFINDDHYVVKAYRKDKKHKNNRYIFKNGTDITPVNSDLTLAKLEEIFMPKKIFMYCMMFSSFAELKHSQQKEILDKILNLEQFDTFGSNISKNIDKLSKQLLKKEVNIPVYQNTIDKNNETISRITTELETEKENVNNLLSEYRDQIKSSLVEVNKNKDIVDILKSLNEQYNQLWINYLSTKNELENAYNEMNSKISQEKIKNESEIKEYYLREKDNISETKVKPIRENIDSLVNSIHLLEKQKLESISEINTKILNAREAYSKKLEEELKPVKNQQDELNVLLIQLDNKSSKLNESLEKDSISLQDLESNFNKEIKTCSSCGQELVSKESLKKISDQIEKLKSNISSYNKSLKQVFKEKSEINSKISILDDKQVDIIEKYGSLKEKLEKTMSDTLCSAQNDFDQKILIYNNTKTKLESDIKELSNSLNKLVESKKAIAVEEYEKLKTTIKNEYEIKAKTLNKKIDKEKLLVDNINKEIEKAKDIERKYFGDKERVNSLKDKGLTLKNSFDSNKKSKEELLSKILIENEKTQEKINSVNSNTKSIKQDIEILKFWKKGFSDVGIRAFIIDESIPILNEKARELMAISNLIRIKFDSQSQTQSGELRNKFLIDGTHVKNLSKIDQFSAGEKRMANIIIFLCLRHLLEHMSNIRFNVVLLDEALDKLDPSNAALVVQMIRNLTVDHCVVLVTHTFREYIESDESLTL